MKVRREIRFSSSKLDASAVLAALKAFSTEAPFWEFDSEQSVEYVRWVNGPACVLRHGPIPTPTAALYIAKGDRPRTFYIANIVPLTEQNLTISEYNDVATKFSADFSSHCRKTKTPIRVVATNSEVSFDDIITAPIPRKYFNQFLAAHPRSDHPNDIERLDKFTCTLAAYARRPLNLDRFECLLMEKLGWSEKDAKWCRDRVETGLELLAVYRKLF